MDKVKESREYYKKIAVEFVKRWADKEGAKYDEPTRVGTPKGEPIGFPRKKYRAALLLVLFPWCLKLREIAGISGVSVGVLRVWRTERKFKDLMYKKYSELGRLIIAEEIRRAFEKQEFESDYLAIKDCDLIETVSHYREILLFLNAAVSEPVIELVKKGINSEDRLIRLRYFSFMFGLHRSIEVRDEKTQRKWEVEHLDLLKTTISSDIDFLIEAKIRPEVSVGEVREYGERLKEMISWKLDILAG